MITKKTYSLKAVFQFTGQHLVWLPDLSQPKPKKSLKFMPACLAGEAQPSDIQRYADEWKETRAGDLAQHLGMSIDEFARWFNQGVSVATLLEERRQKIASGDRAAGFVPKKRAFKPGSMKKPFIDACLDGEATPEDIDDYIDRWHGDISVVARLHNWLGMTEAEYGRYLREPDALPAILQARRAA